MNKDYKEKLIELKNYLILASMIGGISLLPGCTGQKLEKPSNEQAAFIVNIANVEIDSTLNDDVAIVVYENGKYIIHDLKDATANEKAVVFIDSLELETGNYIDYDDIKKKYKKKK